MKASSSPKKTDTINCDAENEETETLPPPLKWAGGKRWLVPRLKALYKQCGSPRLVEPFVGGMAVALGLEPSEALLTDINPHLINFYRQLKEGLNITGRMEYSRECYYNSRDAFNILVALGGKNSKSTAELFYYLNRTCYNGLCRFNRKGDFNVPFGKYRTVTYCRDFSAYKPFLTNWQFWACDFVDVPLREGDFLYADPPYDGGFTKYSKGGFQWDDQLRLAPWLAHHNGPVVVSNLATSRILDLYASWGFGIRLLMAPRRISCTGDRAEAFEMLAFKNFEHPLEIL